MYTCSFTSFYCILVPLRGFIKGYKGYIRLLGVVLCVRFVWMIVPLWGSFSIEA